MSRRKQQNPKSFKGGETETESQHMISTYTGPTSETQDDDGDDKSQGFLPLVINTDDASPNESQTQPSSLTKSIKEDLILNGQQQQSQKNSSKPVSETPNNSSSSIIENYNRNINRDLNKRNSIDYTNSIFNTSAQVQQHYQFYSDADNNSISSETSQTSSIKGGLDSNEPYYFPTPVLGTVGINMTRIDAESTGMAGVDESGMPDGGDYQLMNGGSGMLSIDDSSKPKMSAPNKTRRKSDKIIPITDETGLTKFICPVCKNGFDNDTALTKHIRMHNTSSAVNTCKICGKVLSSQSSLDRHMLVHSGERPFRCKICKMSFTTNGNMHRHSRIHGKDSTGSVDSTLGLPSEQQNEAAQMPFNQQEHPNNQRIARRSIRPSSYQHYQPPRMLPKEMQRSFHPQPQSIKRKSSTDSDGNESYLESSAAKRFFFGLDDSTLMDRENVEMIYSPDKNSAKKGNKKTSEKEDGDENSEPLQCPICLKPFLCKYGLDTHYDVHLSTQPCMCQICHTSFQTSEQVYIHYLLSHINVNKIDGEHQLFLGNKNKTAGEGKTAEDLESGFEELSDLTDFSSIQFPHIAKAWCEKNKRKPSSPYHNYFCHKCEHAFPCSDALLSHLQNHPNECNVTCQLCDVNFVKREKFEDHVTQHSIENIVNNYSKKVGTDDNDIQDMVSQPEFMLVLGLKTTNSKFTLKNCDVMAEVKKALKDNSSGPAGTKVGGVINHEMKPVVIQPISESPLLQSPVHNMNQLYTAVNTASNKKHRASSSMNNALTNNPHPAFPPQLRLFPTPDVSGNHQNNPNITTTGSDVMIKGTNDDPVEIGSSSEDEKETGINAQRPWQCVICEFAFPSKPQCVKHCRKRHSLTAADEINSAMNYSPFTPLVHNTKPPAWSFKQFLCKLCRNGFSNKANSMKHVIVQHNMDPASAEKQIALNKLLENKTNHFKQQQQHQQQPGVSETVKGIQAAAWKQRLGSSSVVWNNKSENQKLDDMPAPPVLSGPYPKGGMINQSVYITSPPISHPVIKSEPNTVSSNEDNQPLDFSMKSNNLKKKKESHQDVFSRNYNTQDLSFNNQMIGSEEEPMDLTVKATKDEDEPGLLSVHNHMYGVSRGSSSMMNTMSSGGGKCSPSSNRGVVTSQINVRAPLSSSLHHRHPLYNAYNVNSISVGVGGGRTSFKNTSSSSPSCSFGVVNNSNPPPPYNLLNTPSPIVIAPEHISAANAASSLSSLSSSALQHQQMREQQSQQRRQQQQHYQPMSVMDQQTIIRFFNPLTGKFQCPLCRMSFKHGGQMHNHIQSHHRKPVQSVSCNQCHATFPNSNMLDRHIVSKHPQSERQQRQNVPFHNNSNNISPEMKQNISPMVSPHIPDNSFMKASPNHSITKIPTPRDYNSDSELSSVPSMLDTASTALNFHSFVPTSNNQSTPFMKKPVVSSNNNNREKRRNNTSSVMESDDSHVDGYDSLSVSSKETSQQEPQKDEQLNAEGEKKEKKKRNSYSDSPHKLQCPYCPRAFPWISSLKRHILTHTGQKPFKCPECPVTFSTKSNRERHMVRKHGLNINDPATRQAMEKPYSCHTCSENFTCAIAIQKHYNDVHPEEEIPEYIVQQAKFEVAPSSGDDSHLDAMSIMSGEPSDGVNSSLKDFDEEDEEDEAESTYSCDSFSSPSKIATAASIPTPQQLHSNNQSPLNPASAQLHNSPINLSNPTSTVPDTSTQAIPEYLNKINPERDNYNVDRITRCWKCGDKYESRKILLRHLKEHNIDNAFKCYLCDASYDSRAECLDHIMHFHPHDWALLREKNKCYNINEYSENMEKLVNETIENLGVGNTSVPMVNIVDGNANDNPQAAMSPVKHNNSHTDFDGCVDKDGMDKVDSDYAQRKVFCSFCVKRFWSLQDLRRHMRSHTGERPFECDICQKRFTLKHSMMRHRRKHTPAELAEATGAANSSACSVVSGSDEDTNMDDGASSNGPISNTLKVALFSRNHHNIDTSRSTPTPRGLGENNNESQPSPVLTSPPEENANKVEANKIPNKEVEDEQDENSDILHNLLGINSSKIDELITSINLNSAAQVLGMNNNPGSVAVPKSD